MATSRGSLGPQDPGSPVRRFSGLVNLRSSRPQGRDAPFAAWRLYPDAQGQGDMELQGRYGEGQFFG